MKTLLTLIILLAQPVLACTQSEALIVAEISEITPLENDSCKVLLGDFSYFQEHVFCPLSKEEVLSMGITLEGSNCEKSIGDSIDGVVVFNGKEITLD